METTNIQEVLSHFEGVKECGDGKYMACCPCHNDRKQSLSIGRGEKGVVLKCHAGCDTHDIIARVGIKPRDLFYDAEHKSSDRPQVVAIYNYPGGVQKLRKADKSFTWRQPDGRGGWIYSRKGVKPSLYIAGEISGAVAVVEGEKDADSIHNVLGCNAVSGADGAGPGKWRKEYTEQLRGCAVLIFQDNDDVGKAYAQETAAALHGVAASVQLLDLATVWPDIPEHGDVSDLIATFGAERAGEMIAQLIQDAPQWEQAPDPLLSLFKPLEDFPEEETKWLIPGWIPEGQIAVLAADGGIGKTSVWCNVIAALSSGRACILDPPGYTREPMKVMFLTTEDSVRKKLRKKLRLAGANMKNIITPDFVGDRSGMRQKLKLGSKELETALRHFRPALCIFDPIQGFTDRNINMGNRNEMRDCTAPLIDIGEEINVTSLIVCHTNKRKGAYGRDRIADSADIWDAARSVIMAGYTEEQGIRYLSNEKNNYAQLQETILFSIDEAGQVNAEGTTWKRDREYCIDNVTAVSAPKREDCKEWLLQTLTAEDGVMPSKSLEDAAQRAGFSFHTLRRARGELKKDGAIKHFATGSARDGSREWHIQLVDPQPLEPLPDDTETPFPSA